MIYSDNDIEQFDDFIKGDLSKSDTSAFEQRLAADEVFSKRFLLYKKLINQVNADASIEASLKVRFDKLDKKQQRKRWFLGFSMAASFIGVIIFLFFINDQSKQSTLSEFKVMEPGLPITMGEEGDVSWLKIMQLYKAQNYRKAYALTASKETTDTTLYFSGLFKELLGKKSESINYYEQVLKINKPSIFKAKVEYRLAVLFWELNNKSAAQQLLQNIAAEPSHIYYDNAMKLLKELSTD